MRFSEAVFAGYGITDGDIRDDYKDLKVAGKLRSLLMHPADYKSSATGFNAPFPSMENERAMQHGFQPFW